MGQGMGKREEIARRSKKVTITSIVTNLLFQDTGYVAGILKL